MPDLLVKLYDFEPDYDLKKRLSADGIHVKRAISPEKTVILEWVKTHFSVAWSDECSAALCNRPSTCFVAYKDGEILGFACCEATAPNFFGPTGVDETMRGKGIGKALLHACLEHQKSMGYAYSVIGGAAASAIDFYAKCCGSVIIEDSRPGIYKDMLKAKTKAKD